jgi:hypothetical protein
MNSEQLALLTVISTAVNAERMIFNIGAPAKKLPLGQRV